MNTAIIVASTKKYSYIWDIFFLFLRKNWPDCELPIYFISDGDPSYLSKYGVNVHKLDVDIGFLNSYEFMMKQISTQYENIILMQEDFLVENIVDNDLIMKLIKIITNNKKIGYIRLKPEPGPNHDDYIIDDVVLGRFGNKQRYLFSYQITMWNIKHLTNLLNSYKNRPPGIWSAEKDLTRILTTRKNNLLLGIKKCDKCPIPYTATAIVRGKLQDWAAKMIMANGFGEYLKK